MAQVKVSKKENWRTKLPDQENQTIIGDQATWGEVHRLRGIAEKLQDVNYALQSFKSALMEEMME